MKEIRKDLVKRLNRFHPGDGKHETVVPGVYCIKRSQIAKRQKDHWRACIGIVIEGCKEIVLGREIYRCDSTRYIVTPIDLPVISRVSAATTEKPFISLLMSLDPVVLSELASQFEKEPLETSDETTRAMFTGDASEEMLAASLRLVKLFDSPKDAKALGPLIIKEILYHALKGPSGPAILRFVRSESAMHKISEAIFKMSSELSEDVDVEIMAKAASMSRSAFFKRFKDATAMSPIQFQKRLRLLEARRLMVDDGETAERSAFKVGYKSTSQFSREYTRLFGDSPLRDAKKLRPRNP